MPHPVQIDGSTDLAFTEDVKARYEAYGWQVCQRPIQNRIVEMLERSSKMQNTLNNPQQRGTSRGGRHCLSLRFRCHSAKD